MPNRAVSQIIQGRSLLTAPPDTPVSQIAAQMKAAHLGAVLVVDEGGRLLGICTERDMVFKVLAESLPCSTPVSGVMTPNPIVVGPERRFGDALHLMFEGGFRHMPVVGEGGLPQGVISSRDALGLEVSKFVQELEIREGLAEVM